MKSARLVLAALLSLVSYACLASAAPVPKTSWKLAFTRRDNAIWIANGDGTGQHPIIRNGHHPNWSPDRRHIAFMRNGDIWIADADGRHQRQLTSFPSNMSRYPIGRGISWHPSGRFISFARSQDYTLKADGGGPVDRIEAENIYDVPVSAHKMKSPPMRCSIHDRQAYGRYSINWSPAWSPSGKRFAFSRNGDIWLADAADSKEYRPNTWMVGRLAPVAEPDASTAYGDVCNAYACNIHWLPGNRALIYERSKVNGTAFIEVRLLRLKPNDKEAEWDDQKVESDKQIISEAYSPTLSPDGRFIACYRSGYDAIWCFTIDGTPVRELVKAGYQPAW